MEEITRLARADILAMTPYSSARNEGTQQAEVFLDANENPYPPFPATKDVIGLNRYPEPQPQTLIERFAQIYDVDSRNIFLSRGGGEAIDLLIRSFCQARTDSILITPPSFGLYETAATIQGAGIYRVKLDEHFQINANQVLQTHKENPLIKLVFLCSPNNPTGNLLDHQQVLAVTQQLFGKALVVMDHTYIDFSGALPLTPQINTHPNLVILRTLSKEYSLTGERMGITVAHPDVISILRRVMAPYPITTSTIRNVSVALTDEGLRYARANIELILQERTRVANELAKCAAVQTIFPSDANFLLVTMNDAHQAIKAMEAKGIKIRNRDSEVSNSVRISIGTPEENNRMLRVISQL